MPPLKQDVLDFLDLKRDPFSTVLMDGHFHHTPEFLKVHKLIRYAVDHYEMVAVVGKIGSGKSEALREVRLAFASQLEPKVEFVGVPHPDRSKLKIGSVLEAFAEHFKSADTSRSIHRRSMLVRMELAEAHQEKRRLCLVLDEAHRVSGHFLKDLKGFHEQSRWADKPALFSIVLVGHAQLIPRYQKIAPDVWERLDANNIVKMGEMTPLEVAAYIEHRMHAAGGNGLFDGTARRAVGRLATSPLAVNRVCWRLMCGAYDAEAKTIGKNDILHIFDRAELRETLNLSYQEIADRAGIGKSTVVDVMSGKAKAKSVEAVDAVINDEMGSA